MDRLVGRIVMLLVVLLVLPSAMALILSTGVSFVHALWCNGCGVLADFVGAALVFFFFIGLLARTVRAWQGWGRSPAELRTDERRTRLAERRLVEDATGLESSASASNDDDPTLPWQDD